MTLKKRIKTYEIAVIFFFLTEAQFFLYGLNSFTSLGGRTTILSGIIGSILAYLFLNRIPKSTSILESKLSLIIFPFLFFQISFAINQTIYFTTYNVVDSISYYLICISLLLLILYCAKKGLKTIARSSFIYLLVNIFLFLITYIALFPKMEFTNVLPIIDNSFTQIIKSSFIYFILALSPYFYLIIFEKPLGKDEVKALKRGYVFTHIFHNFHTLIVLSILGLNLTNIYPYPETSIFKKVSFLNIIDRMESIFSFSYFVALFLLLVITFYTLYTLLKKNFKIKKEEISLLILTSVIFFFTSGFQIGKDLWLMLLVSNILFYFITSKSILR